MTLPPNFRFSQSVLQDFVDCKRRFELRYLLNISWPAIKAQPAIENELHLQQGARFHHMVRQHQLGVPSERIFEMVSNDQRLTQWWHDYLRYFQKIDTWEGDRHPEITLSASIDVYNLIAKLDLLVIIPGEQVLIFDWKTSHRRPDRKWLSNRVQTHLYPYLVVESGRYLNKGKRIKPEDVEMVYWFPNFPNQQAKYQYNPEQYSRDTEYLRNLVKQIEKIDKGQFPLTDDLRQCRYCVYRSLCNRGSSAGPLDEIADQFDYDKMEDLDFNFEQIAEIEY